MRNKTRLRRESGLEWSHEDMGIRITPDNGKMESVFEVE